MTPVEVFEKVISFISQNFELMFTLNIALLISLAVLIVALKLTYMAQDRVLHIFWNNFLFSTIVLGLIISCLVMSWVILDKHKQTAKELSFSRNIIQDISWVREKELIYYINEGQLFSIKPSGKDRRVVFETDSDIREYHFSPDGKYILIVTQEKLVLFDRKSKKQNIVDTLGTQESIDIKGAISSIRWARDSKKFCYELSRWSKFASQDRIYVYDVRSQNKRSIKSPLKRISSLYWDYDSENLYYLRYSPQDIFYETYKQRIKVYQIPLESLKVEYYTDILLDSHRKPALKDIQIPGIRLYIRGERFSFGVPISRTNLTAPNGDYLYIDPLNHLFYIRPKGFMYKWFEKPKRKRLFKIPYQELPESDTFQYEVKQLVIEDIRWLPSSRYALLEHKEFGILILDPRNNRVGQLTKAKGHTFGWYHP